MNDTDRGDAEIARLRLEAAHAEIARLRLTDAEREAIVQAIGLTDWHRAYFSHLRRGEPLPSATLRGLLERLA